MRFAEAASFGTALHTGRQSSSGSCDPATTGKQRIAFEGTSRLGDDLGALRVGAARARINGVWCAAPARWLGALPSSLERVTLALLLPRRRGSERDQGRAHTRQVPGRCGGDHGVRCFGGVMGHAHGGVPAVAGTPDPPPPLVRRNLDYLLRGALGRVRSMDRLRPRAPRPAARAAQQRRAGRHRVHDRHRPSASPVAAVKRPGPLALQLTMSVAPALPLSRALSGRED